MSPKVQCVSLQANTICETCGMGGISECISIEAGLPGDTALGYNIHVDSVTSVSHEFVTLGEGPVGLLPIFMFLVYALTV